MLIYNYGAFRVLYIYKTSNNAANFQSKKVWLGLLLTGGFGNLTDLKTEENSSP
jgi:lipoprotein signal peptidase